MVKKPSRAAWRPHDNSPPKLTRHAASELPPSAKAKHLVVKPHALTPIGAIPKTTTASPTHYHGTQKIAALKETEAFLDELRKRLGLDYAAIAAMLRRLEAIYQKHAAFDDPLDELLTDHDDETREDGIGTRDAEQIAPPSAAPETWKARDLNRRENAPQFIHRVYAPWLGKGLCPAPLIRGRA